MLVSRKTLVGNIREAKRMLQGLLIFWETTAIFPPGGLVLISTGLGERETAFERLAEAFEEHSGV